MVDRKKTPVFPQQATMRDFPGFLSDEPKADWGGMLPVDNPDGVVRSEGLGAYTVGRENARAFSQGAGTVKGPSGNASGMGQSMRVKGGS